MKNNSTYDTDTISLFSKYLDSNVLYMELSPVGNIVAINSLMEKTLGFSNEEIISKDIFSLWNSELIKEHKKYLTKEEHKINIDFLCKDKKYKTLQTSVIPVLKDGNIIKILLFATDITRITELEENMGELHKTMEFLQSAREEIIKRELLLAGIYEAIDFTSLSLELDIQGNITKVNNLFLKVLGFKYQDVMEKSFFNFIEEKDKSEIKDIWDSILQGLFYNNTISLIKKNNLNIPVGISFTPVRDIDGDIFSIILLANILPQ